MSFRQILSFIITQHHISDHLIYIMTIFGVIMFWLYHKITPPKIGGSQVPRGAQNFCRDDFLETFLDG